MPRKASTYYDEDDLDDEDDYYDDYEEDEEVTDEVASQVQRQPSAFASTLAPSQQTGRSQDLYPVRPAGLEPQFDFSTPSPDDVLATARRGNPPAVQRAPHVPPSPSQPSTASTAASTTAPSQHSSKPPAAAPPKASQRTQYRDPAGYVMEASLREVLRAGAGGKEALHVVVLGHVDAGKSTLMGRLLHDLGFLDRGVARKNMQEAQKAGKGSFGWAWAFDERPEERERGVTIDISTRRMETDRFAVTLLDAPGHRDFVPNMITGAAQADAALLIVDGSRGGFESGFAVATGPRGGGQTREHVHAARSLGIKQLAVVVTKLDTCGYDEGRFAEVCGQLEPFLAACGFRACQWLPAAALAGQNVTAPPTDPALSAWWTQRLTVAEAIDRFQPVMRAVDMPFRLVVTELLNKRSLGGFGVAGKVESGAVQPGSKVYLLPSGQMATVKAVEQQGEARAVARAGDSVDVGLKGASADDVQVGSVLCHPEYPVHVARRLQARVLVVNATRPVIPGQSAILHMHSTSTPCKISRLVALLDAKTGASVKEGAAFRMLLKDQAAVVELTLEADICVEVVTACPALGRLILRIGGVTIAVGTLLQVLESE